MIPGPIGPPAPIQGAEDVAQIRGVEGPVVVPGGVQVEEPDEGVSPPPVAVADPGHDGGEHVGVGIADEGVHRQGRADQLVHPVGKERPVHHGHGAEAVVLPQGLHLLHGVEENGKRRGLQLLQALAAGLPDELLPVFSGLLRGTGQADLRELPRAGEQDRPPEEPRVGRVDAEILNGHGPGALAHEGQVLRVAAEVRDVGLYPAQGGELVVQAEVALPAVPGLELRMGQVAQNAHPVVGEDGDDAFFRQGGAVEGALPVEARVEAAAVEKQDHRGVLRLVGRVDVQIQTVLVIGEIQPLPELPLVEAAGGVVQMLVDRPVLGAAGAEPGGVKHALPALHGLGVGKALRPGKGKTPELPAAAVVQPPQGSAGGFQQNGFHLHQARFLCVGFIRIGICSVGP